MQRLDVRVEQNIKRGWNIYFYYWTIPIFFGLIVFNYFTRTFKVEALDINLMISVVSFLFGFLISIVFTMLLSRIATLKESLASEAGILSSVFLLSKKLGKVFHRKIRQRIDDYTVSTLRNYKNYELSMEAFRGMYDDMDLAQVKSKDSEGEFGYLISALNELAMLREKLEYLTSRRIEWSLKFSSYILGTILIMLLFLNRGDTFTNALFVVLSTVIIFIFLIIEDYDNLRIGDYTYNISNSEEIFDMIEMPRYYPQSVLNRVELIPGTEYRIGLTDKKTKQEKIIKLVYNPHFKSRLNFLSKKFRREMR
jgi:hypothetical protein